MGQRGAGGGQILLAVGDAAVVFAPSHFGRVGGEVRAGDMVVHADFGAAKAAEEALGLLVQASGVG